MTCSFLLRWYQRLIHYSQAFDGKNRLLLPQNSFRLHWFGWKFKIKKGALKKEGEKRRKKKDKKRRAKKRGQKKDGKKEDKKRNAKKEGKKISARRVQKNAEKARKTSARRAQKVVKKKTTLWQILIGLKKLHKWCYEDELIP